MTVFDHSKENHVVSEYHIDYKFDEYGNISEELWKLIHEDPEKTRDYQKYIYEYYEPTNVQETRSGKGFLSVSPNPASDNINITINGLAGEDAVISINDVYGNCLYYNNYRKVEDNFELAVDIANLSSGIYTVSMTLDDKTESRKVVVIR
jgi:hypothetical protein